MKYFRSIAYALILSIILSSCSALLLPSPYSLSGLNAGGEAVIYTQYETYSSDMKFITLIIKNVTNIDITFGDEWQLEVMRSGVWYYIPLKKNVGWNDLAYTLPPDKASSQKLGLSGFDYEIKDGTYRVVKEINGDTYSTVFSIGESEISAKTPFGFAPLEELPQEYSEDDAIADGVVLVREDEIFNGEKLAQFVFNVNIGAEDLLRTAAYTIEGELVISDVTFYNTIYGNYFLTRTDMSRVNLSSGGIYTSVDSYLVTDGKYVYLSNHVEYKENDIRVLIPYHTEWEGWESAVPFVKEMTSRRLWASSVIYTSWSRDGMRNISLFEESLSFGYTVSNGSGYFGSSAAITDKMKIAVSIRKAEWIDDKVVMLVCNTNSELTYYEFIDTDTFETLAYTSSPTKTGYSLTIDGVIIYSDENKDSFTYPSVME